MDKFVTIKDPTGTFTINKDNVVAITEDLEGKFGCLIYTKNPEIYFQLRTPYSEVIKLFND